MNIKLVEKVLNKTGRIATTPIRTLPDFIIIGSKKCGTTSLFNYLSKHPSIDAPTKKEISYFNKYFTKGKLWYKSFFPISLPISEPQDLITGEATASYICNPQAPERIAQTLPDVKLIALLRNPIDRAYSHYHHTRRIGRETLNFEEAIASEELRLEQIKQKSQTPGFKYHEAYNYTYLSSGKYAEQLKNWFDLFERQQLLILKSEDFFSHPEIIYQQVLDFLNLPSWSPKNYRKYNYNRYSQSIKPNTKKFLQEYFQPHNQKLYELLGVDYGWN